MDARIARRLERGHSPVLMGRAAHKIEDYVQLSLGVYGVYTPFGKWHTAHTPREKNWLRRRGLLVF